MQKLILLGLTIALVFGLVPSRGAQDQQYDLVLKNGRVVDGSGNAWYRADIAIRGDTIVRIAPSIDARARRVIDAGGHVIAPGFIDIHTHARRGISQCPPRITTSGRA